GPIAPASLPLQPPSANKRAQQVTQVGQKGLKQLPGSSGQGGASRAKASLWDPDLWSSTSHTPPPDPQHSLSHTPPPPTAQPPPAPDQPSPLSHQAGQAALTAPVAPAASAAPWSRPAAEARADKAGADKAGVTGNTTSNTGTGSRDASSSSSSSGRTRSVGSSSGSRGEQARALEPQPSSPPTLLDQNGVRFRKPATPDPTAATPTTMPGQGNSTATSNGAVAVAAAGPAVAAAAAGPAAAVGSAAAAGPAGAAGAAARVAGASPQAVGGIMRGRGGAVLEDPRPQPQHWVEGGWVARVLQGSLDLEVWRDAVELYVPCMTLEEVAESFRMLRLCAATRSEHGPGNLALLRTPALATTCYMLAARLKQLLAIWEKQQQQQQQQMLVLHQQQQLLVPDQQQRQPQQQQQDHEQQQEMGEGGEVEGRGGIVGGLRGLGPQGGQQQGQGQAMSGCQLMRIMEGLPRVDIWWVMS
ncbi:hypothetical protein QJQ45_018334, partial [Haematococcus lacustris]